VIADFYLCPNCLHIEFGEIVEEDLKTCPKCGNEVLRVYASGEAQHLIMDIWNDHEEKIASLAVIVLAKASKFPTLSVEVRDRDDKPLKKEELANILRKNKEFTEKLAEILGEYIT